MVELEAISPVLTEDYLSQRLTKWFGRDVQYTKHEFSDEAFGKGDSYLSDVYRIIFHGRVVSPEPGEKAQVSVRTVMKTFPKNIARKKTFRSAIFFNNEINFYEQILPKLLEFEASKKVSNPFVNIPKLFASNTDGENDFLALEDMKPYGFGSAIRQEGIDYPHCEKTLETFAKFHALSFAFKDQHPEEYKKMAKCVPEVYYAARYWDWYKGFWNLLCIVAKDAVDKEFPNTIYQEKVHEFASVITFDRMIAATHANTKSDVIGHGDSWTANFLFKYKEGSMIPLESRMIDFQLTRSASPVLDISFFIYACTSQKLRLERYHDMLKHYHDTLSAQMRDLGSDPDKVYSWDFFMEEIGKYSYFGVAFSFESTPASILAPEDAFAMDEITGTEAVKIEDLWNVKPIKSQAGRLRLSEIVVHAVDNGYI